MMIFHFYTNAELVESTIDFVLLIENGHKVPNKIYSMILLHSCQPHAALEI